MKSRKTFVTYRNGAFVAESPNGIERLMLQRASFVYNPVHKYFETRHLKAAFRLYENLDGKARQKVRPFLFKEYPVSERPTSVYVEGLHDFQKEGVDFAMARNHSYIAFEQGLGKTATAISIALSVNGPALIVCPPFLVENWKRELMKWAPNHGVSLFTDLRRGYPPPKFTILADSYFSRPNDAEAVAKKKFRSLLVDEAQRFKTLQAKRTYYLFGVVAPRVPRVVLLSGTPMPNRPLELYAPLKYLGLNLIDFMDTHQFGLRYCDAFQGAFGWDYSGSSNEAELREKLKPFVLRRTKENVLKDLKGKIRENVYLDDGASIKVGRDIKIFKRAEAKVLKEFDDDVSKVIDQESLGIISNHRRRLGVLKCRAAIDYLDSTWTKSEPMLVFAYHRDVVEALAAHFWVTPIFGSTPIKARDEIVKNFQGGRTDVLVANLKTMVGYNLTRATRVVFVEYSWSPSDNDQAEDRAHRIGQDSIVRVQYIVLPDSLDERVLNAIYSKKSKIKTVLNDLEEREEE